MRIVYLSAQRIPSRAANGVQTMQMCTAFATLGHEVELLCRPGTETADPFDYYGVPRSFAMRAVRDDVLRGTRTLHHLRVVRRTVQKRRPDLLFGRDLYALCATAGLGIPQVLEVHRALAGRVEVRAFSWLLRQPSLRRFVVVSHGMRREYERRFPRLRDLVQVEPGAATPIDPAGPVEPLPGRQDALRVGYVGHLYEGRGVDVLIEAAARAPEIDLHLVGGNDADVDAWRARAHTRNVFFHGHVSPARVPRFLRAFEVLGAPYQRRVYVDGGAETAAVMSPLKLFEYMSVGRAIVSSDLPVLREVLDERVALLVPPEDPAAWAAAFRELRDARRRRALAEEAQRRCLERHTWAARAQRILAEVR